MGQPVTKANAAERGRAGGKASAEARRAKKLLAADLRARKKFEDSAEELAQQLLDAAFGRGVFGALDPKERAQYTVKALEYATGRPRQATAMADGRGLDPDDEPGDDDGIAFGDPDAPTEDVGLPGGEPAVPGPGADGVPVA